MSKRIFDGDEGYDPDRDNSRLMGQLMRVGDYMADYEWHTLPEISAATGDPESSVSARLRDFRKPKFGGFNIERRYKEKGLHEYRMNL